MNPAIKRAMLNFIGRWWYVYAMLGVFQAGTAYAFFAGHGMIPLAGVLMGAFLIALDYRRSFMQTLLTFPISLDELSRINWLLAVALPGLLITAINFVVGGIAVALGHALPTTEILALVLAMPWAMLGFGHIVMANISLASMSGGEGYSKNSGWQALWGAHIPLMMMGFPTGDKWRAVAWLLTLVGTFGAGYAWANRRELLLKRFTSQSSKETKPASDLPRSGLRGWSVLWREYGKRMAMSCGWAVVMLTVFGMLSGSSKIGGQLGFMRPFLSIVGIMLSLQWFYSVRPLRALPMTATQLALLFVLMPLIPTGIFLGFADAYQHLSGASLGLQLTPHIFLSFAVQAMAPGAVMRWGKNLGVILGCVFGIAFPLSLMREPYLLNVWFAVGLVLGLIVLGFWWARFELQRGTQTYQPRELFPRFNSQA